VKSRFAGAGFPIINRDRLPPPEKRRDFANAQPADLVRTLPEGTKKADAYCFIICLFLARSLNTFVLNK